MRPQHVGWFGHADGLQRGSEQVATNWVDMQAIRISNNGKQTQETCPNDGYPGPDCCGGCGRVLPGNDQGDLWVDGGAGNLGKYEDASGVWHTVPGWSGSCPATQAADMPAAEGARHSVSVSVDKVGSIRISPSVQGRMNVRIMDMQGHTLYSATLAGPMAIPAGTLKPGVYLISGNSGNTAFSTEFIILR